MRRQPRDERSRDETDTSESQGTPRIDGYHEKLGKGKGEFYPESQKEH